MAVSLTRGDTIIAIDAGSSMQPASTQKLFTAALALDQLGADHHFRTAVLRSGQVDSNGVLQGDLILRGGGDPAFSDRFADDSTVTPVNQLAARVRQSGIAAVTGRLLADPFAFDSTLVPDGWLNRYLHAPYAARVSALSLNENVASVVVAPAESENATIAVLDPPASTMSVQNSVRLIPGARGSSIALRRLDDLTFEARGWIGQRASALRLAVVVDNPASFTAGAFRAALGERGIRIGGETVVSAAPREAVFVTDLESPPLSRLVTAMNRESINHYAELIFRNAGRGVEELQEGSAQSGFSQLSDFLASKVGTDPGSVYAVDGSGLSVLNRVTPRALVQLLSYAHYAPWGDVFHASMPVAGQSATLRDRMRNTSADGNLHAKTGTTSNVVSLSGYVTAANGEVLAFAFIYNGPDGARARSAIDHLGMGLANFARR
jgi:D-alanyl-D-alanine carboxypeptidase/D-alanyl-D-alanine-endopeptidase (penicillin-binding protein 4)